MPENVTIREEMGLIHIESFGELTVEDLQASLDQVVQSVHDTGFMKILVDARRLLKTPDTLPSFEFVEELLRRARQLRFAILSSEPMLEKLTFVETVARNRGGQVRVFLDRDEALKWLSSSTSPLNAGDA